MFLISDNIDTRTGMRLVGVEGEIAHTREEVSAELDKALADKNIGIIAVTELLMARYHDLFDAVRESRGCPLVVAVPDRHGTHRHNDFITQYVRDAIGVKL